MSFHDIAAWQAQGGIVSKGIPPVTHDISRPPRPVPRNSVGNVRARFQPCYVNPVLVNQIRVQGWRGCEWRQACIIEQRLESSTMLKISIQETEGGKVTLLLAGRIANSEVEQLRSSSRQVLDDRGTLTLDLAGVSFIDRNGIALIHTLEDQNVDVIKASPFVTEQLKRKTTTAAAERGQQKKKKGKSGDEQQ